MDKPDSRGVPRPTQQNPANNFLGYLYVLRAKNIVYYFCVSLLYVWGVNGNVWLLSASRADSQLSAEANSAFYPSGVGKWRPASAGKEKQVWFIPLADECGVCR